MHTITDEDFLDFVGNQESQFIIPASETTDEVLARLNNDESMFGDLLPWSKTHKHFRMRPGEVSLWFAYNGHGKSQMLGMICAWNLQHKKWLIASMEMKPSATMTRMVRQVSGNNCPSDNYVKGFMSWTNDRLWIYDQLDTVKEERILGMIRYAAIKLGVKHIIIDSLMKCGIKTDDLNAQKQFVDHLCWVAKSLNIHIHLVHHARKGMNEYTRPGKHDARGAGEITDLVDNVCIVHRNKEKEEKKRTGQQVNDGEPDATLTIEKQRHGEWEGTFLLYFHAASMQYIPRPDGYAMPYNMEVLRETA